MKKMIAVLLVALMLVASFTGCSNKKNESSAPAQSSVEESSAAESSAAESSAEESVAESSVEESSAAEVDVAAAYNKILEGLQYDDKDLPVLKVAMSPDFAPMEFVDLSREGQDMYVGFDPILAKYIAKELNMKLEISPMSFDACMVAVQTNNVDLAISGFSWTARRAENFLISDWYKAGENETEQVVISLKENAGKLTKVEDYKDLKVGAQGGSLQELLVNEQLVPAGAKISLYENLNDAVTALMTGKIDALAVAQGNGTSYISANPDKIDFTGFQFEIEEKYKNNVILLNKENNEMLTKVNEVLAKAMAADVYTNWYEASQLLGEIKTIDELGYDDEGNKITE